MKPYYPFTGQPSTYPYQLPYQYAPPPPYFYYMNKDGFPQVPFNCLPEPTIPSYRLNGEGPKGRANEVIDIDGSPFIK
jgi:hypothetical protein